MPITGVDPLFQHIDKNQTCFLIWRVEDLKLAPVPSEDYGKFYNGDSYLIYSATEAKQRGGVNLKNNVCRGPIDRYIHFWLGSRTTQDEAGVAAIKSVELDDFLGGAPVQQREVEGFETSRFLSYFPNGIRISNGGISSGFKHVEDDFKPSLYLVKGKRIPVIKQLAQISWSLMNEGDVYIVDCGELIFVWTGRKSNNYEKIQGAKLAQTLKGERGKLKTSIVFVEDGRENDLLPDEKKAFESFLPISEKKLQNITEVASDETQESSKHQLKLFRCTDQNGSLEITLLKTGILKQADLDAKDSFIIDYGSQGVYVWVGRGATKQERSGAMKAAQDFIEKNRYPASTKSTRVIDGGEPPEFKSLFHDWKEKEQSAVPYLQKQNSVGKIAKVVQTKFDASALHSQSKTSYGPTQAFDDGSGKKSVYRIENFALVPVPIKDHGKFFSGDCYVIDYSYKGGSIIYYWLGAKSSQDEQGAAALRTIELDDQRGGTAIQIRVVQNKEPGHFLSMFGGKMIIFSGGKTSAFDRKKQSLGDQEVPTSYLLHVRGNAPNNTRAIQVPMKASSLNSNDAFVLITSTIVYVWNGKGSTREERDVALKLAIHAETRITEPVVVDEGKEPDDFWSILGGRGSYASDKQLAQGDNPHPPRLFHCSNATGRFTAEEIHNFNQSDLIEDDVMILDVWDSIFIWVGLHSNRDEQRKVDQLVRDYLQADPRGRDRDTPVITVKQGYEPSVFTGFFGVWDAEAWNNRVDFDSVRRGLEDPGPEPCAGNTYPLSVLQVKDTDKLPLNVDPTRKEDFLRDADFQHCFKMTREAFKKLPAWKRQGLKKEWGIF